MLNIKELFKPMKNELEDEKSAGTSADSNAQIVQPEVTYTCSRCQAVHRRRDLRANFYVCPACGNYFKISSRTRIRMLTDRGSFVEHDADFTSYNRIGFPDYEEKLQKAMEKSGDNEGVVCGNATIGGYPCCIFAMHPDFMAGSMGAVLGDKLTRLFEYATVNHLPVIGVTLSGGARMQEGIISLIQMAKVSGAIKYHSDAGNLYAVLMTNPTTGGVAASFAMLGDVNLGEPGALIGFAGPRVIEQTIRKKLPEGAQRSEFQLDCGFLDDIVPRNEQKDYLTKLLKLHAPMRVFAEGEEGGRNE